MQLPMKSKRPNTKQVSRKHLGGQPRGILMIMKCAKYYVLTKSIRFAE